MDWVTCRNLWTTAPPRFDLDLQDFAVGNRGFIPCPEIDPEDGFDLSAPGIELIVQPRVPTSVTIARRNFNSHRGDKAS